MRLPSYTSGTVVGRSDLKKYRIRGSSVDRRSCKCTTQGRFIVQLGSIQIVLHLAIVFIISEKTVSGLMATRETVWD